MWEIDLRSARKVSSPSLGALSRSLSCSLALSLPRYLSLCPPLPPPPSLPRGRRWPTPLREGLCESVCVCVCKREGVSVCECVYVCQEGPPRSPLLNNLI